MRTIEQQGIDEGLGQANAPIGGEAATDHGEVFEEIACGAIRRQPRQRRLQHFRIGVKLARGALDARPHAGQVAAISLELEARAEGFGVGVQLRLESLQPRLQLVAER